MFRLSDFGSNYQDDSGIFLLMEDLDEALNQNPDLYMLGGGNPGYIPELQEYFYKKFQQFIDNKNEFLQAIGIYDSPKGNISFRKELSIFFNKIFQWNITYEHIALTHGSQNAFFILFNLFSGKSNNEHLKLFFPLLPEYIGYEQVPITSNSILSVLAKKTMTSDYFFKYEIDKDNFLNIIQKNHQEIGCMAISTPANPTGKIFSKDELLFLKEIIEFYKIPLIIDSAYGQPFPGITFKDQDFIYSDYFIYTFSLSKTGLPGLRMGIVVANPEIISLVGKVQATLSLSPSRIAPIVFKDSFSTMEFYKINHSYIKDYYLKKRNLAINILTKQLSPEEVKIHESEGAFFLWVVFPKLKINTFELYKILKSKGVIVVPGKYYYPGYPPKENDETDANSSIRISFSQKDDIIENGLKILVSTVKDYCIK